MIQQAIEQLSAGRDLSVDQMEACLGQLISGQVSQETTERFLTSLHEKGESTSEVVGGARALRANMVAVQLRPADLVDTCGTGGDGSGTFNISTAAAIVAAACGVKVAKHGNRKITSQSGSADVLAELGVEIACDQGTAQRCLDQAGICFLFAPQFHPAMRHVSAARKNLPFPTIFNLLGPLVNPASVRHQVLGVGKAAAWDLLVPALSRLSSGRCLAVRGQDGLGEMTVFAPTQVALIEPADGKQEGAIRLETWDAREYGLGGGQLEDIQVADPQASGRLIREVLAGGATTARKMVVFNAAAAVWLAGVQPDMPAAIARCQAAIDSGAAAQTLQQLVAASQASA